MSIQGKSILWIVDFEPGRGMTHGGSLRWFNLAKVLVKQGHNIYFATRDDKDDIEERKAFLESLKQSNVITDYLIINCKPINYSFFEKALGYYPSVVSRFHEEENLEIYSQVKGFIEKNGIDSLILSDMFFLTPLFKDELPVSIDWIDSHTLYFYRSVLNNIKKRRLKKIFTGLRNLFIIYLYERYYGKLSKINMFASPIDSNHFRKIHGGIKSYPLLNGIDFPPIIDTEREQNRLIFTGSMDFEPNYEASIWFIDNVLPLVLKKKSNTKFVVAGRYPTQALKDRASESVIILGEVENIFEEIAKSCLYVAPLISGGGFKNKVLEALATKSFIVSTQKGVEFLPKSIREKILVADNPEEFAGNIINFLDNSSYYMSRTPSLLYEIQQQFSWENRARELLSLV